MLIAVLVAVLTAAGGARAQPAGWQVVYDAASAWSPAWPWVAAGLALGAAGAWAVRAGVRASARGEPRGMTARSAAWVLAIFGPSLALFAILGPHLQLTRLRAALRSGEVDRVEGVVHDRPAGPGGASSWVVESGARAHWYRYDDAPLAAGYRRAGPGAGGLRSGDSVRIADVKGRIARVEVRVRGPGSRVP